MEDRTESTSGGRIGDDDAVWCITVRGRSQKGRLRRGYHVCESAAATNGNFTKDLVLPTDKGVSVPGDGVVDWDGRSCRRFSSVGRGQGINEGCTCFSAEVPVASLQPTYHSLCTKFGTIHSHTPFPKARVLRHVQDSLNSTG